MSRLALCVAVVALSLAASAQELPPLESDAIVSPELRELARMSGLLARVQGWRCDSVSGFTPWLFSHGYTLYCNQHRYTYEIEDKGKGPMVSAPD